MSVVSYTAKRSIVPGHSALSVYNLTFGANVIARAPKANRTERKSLNGVLTSRLHYVETFYNVNTVPLLLDLSGTSPAQYFREFIDSVIGNEQFAFDPYCNNPAVPISPILVQLTSSSYVENRQDTSSYVSFSLELREVI